MKTLLSLLTILVIQAVPPQSAMTLTTINGTVTRAGTSDPIADAQITLTIGIPTDRISAVAGGVSAMGIQAASFQSVSAQLMTMSPQEIQVTINQYRAQGLPPALITAVEGMQAMMKSNPGLPLKTISDGSGHFTIRDVPPGQYTLIAQREGYFGPAPNGAPQLPQTAIMPIVVPERQASVQVTASLVPGGVISGRVRDSNGRLANNANVQAFIIEYQNGQPSLSQIAAKQTDGRGEFRIAWLQPGSYIVAATPRPPAVSATAANATPQEISIRTFYGDALDATQALRVAVHAGEEAGGIDIPLRSILPVTVSGHVISSLGQQDASIAPPSALLMLAYRDNSIPENARNVGTVGLNPTTGSFEIHDILPGSYELFGRIQDPGGTPGANGLLPMAWGRTSFEVGNRNIEGISVTVHASVDVRGKVTVDGKAPPAGTAIRIGLQADGPSVRIANYQTVAGRQQTPAADGSFTVPAVAEGAYRVILNGAPADSYVADVRRGTASIYDAGLYVTDKLPDPIEVAVRSDGGKVEGILTQGDSQPLGRTLVVLVPPVPHRANAASYRTTLTDPQGHFILRGVPPGNYQAFAWENLPDGAYLNAEFMKEHENEGVTVEVSEGLTTNTAVRVIANGGGK
jgi:hypothetical protein